MVAELDSTVKQHLDLALVGFRLRTSLAELLALGPGADAIDHADKNGAKAFALESLLIQYGKQLEGEDTKEVLDDIHSLFQPTQDEVKALLLSIGNIQMDTAELPLMQGISELSAMTQFGEDEKGWQDADVADAGPAVTNATKFKDISKRAKVTLLTSAALGDKLRKQIESVDKYKSALSVAVTRWKKPAPAILEEAETAKGNAEIVRSEFRILTALTPTASMYNKRGEPESALAKVVGIQGAPERMPKKPIAEAKESTANA